MTPIAIIIALGLAVLWDRLEELPNDYEEPRDDE